MERRRELRHPVEREVQLWLLAETEEGHPAQLEELSGIGARLRTRTRIPTGAAVRVEWDESMFLGECVHCALVEGGGEGESVDRIYIVGIHFEHVLGSVGDIRRLMESLMAESRREERAPGTKTGPSNKSQSRG